MVPHQVDRDAQDPGLDPAFAPEAGAFLVGAQKAFLGESVGRVGIPHQQEDHPVHAPLVLAHDVVEPLRRDLFGVLASRAKLKAVVRTVSTRLLSGSRAMSIRAMSMDE